MHVQFQKLLAEIRKKHMCVKQGTHKWSLMRANKYRCQIKVDIHITAGLKPIGFLVNRGSLSEKCLD